MSLEVTVLGSGTSTGVPVPGCRCEVCTSDDPRQKRLRASVLLKNRDDGRAILVDTSPDLRQQALANDIERIDAVLYTHAHADHTHGIDDLRTFNFRQGRSIPCYGPASALARIRESFGYIFEEGGQRGGGKPRLRLHELDGTAFEAAGLEVVPVPVLHGELEVFGYRVGRFAYVTDCSAIPDESFERLAGVEVLILDALRFAPRHPTHFTVAEAIQAARRIGARETYLTHLTHKVDARNPHKPLPEGVKFAHDGLRLLLD